MVHLTNLSGFREPTHQEQVQISEHLSEMIQKFQKYIYVSFGILIVILISTAVYFRNSENNVMQSCIFAGAFIAFLWFSSNESQKISSFRRMIAFCDFEVLDCKLVYLYKKANRVYAYFETKTEKCSDSMPIKTPAYQTGGASKTIPEHVLLIKYGEEFELLIPNIPKKKLVGTLED